MFHSKFCAEPLQLRHELCFEDGGSFTEVDVELRDYAKMNVAHSKKEAGKMMNAGFQARQQKGCEKTEETVKRREENDASCEECFMKSRCQWTMQMGGCFECHRKSICAYATYCHECATRMGRCHGCGRILV
eukprot:GDKI01011864.1.p2 GENE.GDKI01011864.1~~GDKI01011864.1.p2  ORF type:complete len:132 (-),score=42.08 GDKI01011864.1:91-486(-)